jgi:hypothetical protein
MGFYGEAKFTHFEFLTFYRDAQIGRLYEASNVTIGELILAFGNPRH